MQMEKKKEARWENVNIGGKGLMMASIGVTKTQTSTNANGEKIVHCWENVNVDANGEMMASTGVTKTQAISNANGEKNSALLGKC